jgi:3D-(3,5/4)-trihydroxycyclohexane-1,2-dione acylhydrolase (decyclizing)
LEALTEALAGWQVTPSYRADAARANTEWDAVVEAAYTAGREPLPAQTEVIGAVNEVSEPRDVVLNAAGSMPGELHKLWRTRDPKGYHVEYGYSTMGYEIAAGVGVRMAAPDRDVFVLVGDGSYLMMAQELVTAVQERLKIVVVLVQNHGFASIGSLSESLGSQRFGTAYRFRSESSGRLDGDVLPVDLAANAASLGVRVVRVATVAELRSALREAKAAPADGGPVLIHVETDPLAGAPNSDAWWDVPVSETAALDTTRAARAEYERQKKAQRPLIGPASEGNDA